MWDKLSDIEIETVTNEVDRYVEGLMESQVNLEGSDLRGMIYRDSLSSFISSSSNASSHSVVSLSPAPVQPIVPAFEKLSLDASVDDSASEKPVRPEEQKQKVKKK